ncbi:MAG: hypothetical protein LBR45_03400 [Bacteroidales bacterium]|jgi:hypothetical protein|nr:hypothetical protein [Bacteroidales bacterium]
MNKIVKLTALITLLGVGVALMACNRVKTCECTVTVSVMGTTQSQTVTGEIEKGKCEDMPEIKEAEEQVNEALAGLGTASVSCKEI